MKIYMKKQNFLLSGFVAVLMSALFISSAPFILAQTGSTVTAGYGYGYGYGGEDEITCHAKRPKKLHAKKTPKPNTIVKLSWKKVKFKDCEKKKPAYYVARIYRKTHLVKKYPLVKENVKQVRNTVLKLDRNYRFKVRAVATDGAKTNWSKWKKFKTPDHY